MRAVVQDDYAGIVNAGADSISLRQKRAGWNYKGYNEESEYFR
jgi:hypothetical protein